MNRRYTEALADIDARIAVWRKRAEELSGSNAPVLLFGSGFYGKFLIKHVFSPGSIKAVADNNPAYWGKETGGAYTDSLENIAAAYPGQRTILLTVSDEYSRHAISKQCSRHGFEVIDFCPESPGSRLPLFGNRQIDFWLSAHDSSQETPQEEESILFPPEPLDDFIGRHYEISYAPSYEDIIFLNYLHPIRKGCYIDIGCFDPDAGSVTKLFYERGWRGINIDARSEEIDKYSRKRPGDINICAGISNFQGELPFWLGGGLSTFNYEHVLRCRQDPRFKLTEFTKTMMPVTTLDSIIENHLSSTDIHFLKIDTEGYEKEVLEGLSLTVHRPWTIMVEGDSSRVENHLLGSEYLLALDFSGNQFYIASEKHTELAANYMTKPILPMMRWEHAKIVKDLLSRVKPSGFADTR